MRFFVISAVASLALMGCKGDESDTTMDTDTDGDTEPQAETARIRVVHASPDAPAVDVYVKGDTTPTVSGLAYGSSSAYLEIPSGPYVFEVRPAGAAAGSAPVYSTGTVQVAKNSTESFVAAGFLAGTGTEAFRVLPVVESYANSANGAFRAILVHASPNAPQVGIDVGNDGTAEVTVPQYGNSPSVGLDLPSTAVAIGIRSSTARLTQFSVPAIAAKKHVLVVAIGDATARPNDPSAFSLLAVFDDATVARVKQDPELVVLHAGPDAPPVDLFVGATEVASDIAFGELSSALQVQPGTYDIEVFAATAGTTRPAGSPAYTVDNLTLAAGDRTLAVAAGFLSPVVGESDFMVTPYADTFTNTPTKGRVVVIHASGDAPAVDVGVSAGCVIASAAFADLAFGEASAGAGVELTPGAYTLGVSATGVKAALVEFPFAIGAGDRYWAVAAGAFSATGAQAPFKILAVDASAWPYTIGTVSIAACGT